MTRNLKTRILHSLVETGKKVVFRHTNLGAPRYPYTVEPATLAMLVNEIDRLKNTPGAIVEIGVARGMTTRFVAEHLISSGLSDQTVYAVDTFSSFVGTDLDYEIAVRGKDAQELSHFAYNDFGIWSQNFAKFPFVKPVQADCANYDFRKIAPIKIVFLDVDLYLPTKTALPRLYDALVPSGIVLIHDVIDGHVWDGAYQAYMEFCGERNMPPTIVGTNCGVIRKPA